MIEILKKDAGTNRYDLIGLAADTKPTQINGDNLDGGSTLHIADTNTDYVYSSGNWYVG